jgi:hypothetical protein
MAEALARMPDNTYGFVLDARGALRGSSRTEAYEMFTTRKDNAVKVVLTA